MCLQSEWLCTKPTLAAKLMQDGYTCSKVASPYNESRTAWLFVVTEEFAETVSAYYETLGRPAPRVIQRALQTQKG